MNRAPHYTKDRAYRMIFVANDHWRVQRFENFKGTQIVDPWSMVGPASDYATAYAALNAHEPIKRAS